MAKTGVTMKLTGLARTQRRLARVYDVSINDVEWALPEVGKIVRDDAAAHLTPHHGYDTGKLARALAVGPLERQGIARFFVKVGPTKEGWYGRFVEFGTRLITAMPFLRPARDRQAGTYKQRLRASQAAAIKKLAAEGGV